MYFFGKGILSMEFQSAYMSMLKQFSSLYIYILAHSCQSSCSFAESQARRMLDRMTIYLVVGLIGVTACAALAFFWRTKIYIGLYNVISASVCSVRATHPFAMSRSYFCVRGSSVPHTRARSGRLHDDSAVLPGSRTLHRQMCHRS